MKTKKIVLCMLVLAYIFSSANNAYAQFWRKWFQKDQQKEQPVTAEQDQPVVAKGIKEDFIAQGPPEYAEEESGMHVEIWTIGEPKDTPEQAAKDAQAAPKAVSTTPAISPTREIDEKQKEEELRRTQEQVDQIKKIQEMNNMQRSLDNIKRINEMNQQQKRIDEINRLNRMQKNLDELRRTTETKK